MDFKDLPPNPGIGFHVPAMVLVEIAELVVDVDRTLHSLCDCEVHGAILGQARVLYESHLVFSRGVWPVLLHRGRGNANGFVRLHNLDDLLRREERERADRDEDDADEHEHGDHAAGRHQGFPCRELLLVEPGVLRS